MRGDPLWCSKMLEIHLQWCLHSRCNFPFVEDLDWGTRFEKELKARIGTHNLDLDLVQSFMELVVGFGDDLMNSALGICG